MFERFCWNGNSTDAALEAVRQWTSSSLLRMNGDPVMPLDGHFDQLSCVRVEIVSVAEFRRLEMRTSLLVDTRGDAIYVLDLFRFWAGRMPASRRW